MSIPTECRLFGRGNSDLRNRHFGTQPPTQIREGIFQQVRLARSVISLDTNNQGPAVVGIILLAKVVDILGDS